jgi:hypothetical protein
MMMTKKMTMDFPSTLEQDLPSKERSQRPTADGGWKKTVQLPRDQWKLAKKPGRSKLKKSAT